MKKKSFHESSKFTTSKPRWTWAARHGPQGLLDLALAARPRDADCRLRGTTASMTGWNSDPFRDPRRQPSSRINSSLPVTRNAALSRVDLMLSSLGNSSTPAVIVPPVADPCIDADEPQQSPFRSANRSRGEQARRGSTAEGHSSMVAGRSGNGCGSGRGLGVPTPVTLVLSAGTPAAAAAAAAVPDGAVGRGGGGGAGAGAGRGVVRNGDCPDMLVQLTGKSSCLCVVLVPLSWNKCCGVLLT